MNRDPSHTHPARDHRPFINQPERLSRIEKLKVIGWCGVAVLVLLGVYVAVDTMFPAIREDFGEYFVGVAVSLLAVPASLVLILLPLFRKKRRQDAGRCINCGYDLRASKGTCPECGYERAGNCDGGQK